MEDASLCRALARGAVHVHERTPNSAGSLARSLIAVPLRADLGAHHAHDILDLMFQVGTHTQQTLSIFRREDRPEAARSEKTRHIWTASALSLPWGSGF